MIFLPESSLYAFFMLLFGYEVPVGPSVDTSA
jgi:hypothetical protein